MKKENIAKPVLRDSSYGDYVAVDMVDERGLIVSTPFYIKEGQTIEAHWPKPQSEQPKNPVHYDDFHDVFQFMMQDGNILSKWANSGLNSVFEIMDKKDLETWDFHKTTKFKVIESKNDKLIFEKMPKYDSNQYTSFRDWAMACYAAGQKDTNTELAKALQDMIEWFENVNCIKGFGTQFLNKKERIFYSYAKQVLKDAGLK